MQTTEQKLQYLLDRFEIQDVIAHYGCGLPIHRSSGTWQSSCEAGRLSVFLYL